MTTLPATNPARHDVRLPQWQPVTNAAAASGNTGHTERTIGYVRLSVTRGCSMRCTYCRPDFDRGHGETAFDARDYAFLIRHLHGRFGLRKVRLTGGEPTTRRDLPEIIRAVRDVGVPDLAMTTNGLSLRRDAESLRRAGLRRINVSLDTLDRARFAALTGVDGLPRVLSGIAAALDAGFDVVKLNTVVVAEQNEADLPGLLTFAADRQLPLRFIELMPMGPLAGSWSRRYVPAERMRAACAPMVRRWVPDKEPLGSTRTRDAARMWTAELRNGRHARVGFITPMSDHFCATCDRLRITADGDIYPCLMDQPRGNLADAVARRDADAVDKALDTAYAGKQPSHPPIAPGIMTHLGG